MKCLGILRETQNSPGRVSDDEAILRAVLDALRAHGVETEIIRPDAAIDEESMGQWDLVLPMCETYPRLKRLLELSRILPAVFLNHPKAALGCYRESLIRTLAGTPGVVVPRSEIRAVPEDGALAPPDFAPKGGFWMKRGDVHNTCEHDVAYAAGARAAAAVGRDFRRREITRVVLQEHVEGDLIKFYGVGPGQWFTWFHHDPAMARKLAFQPEDLAATAESGARAVGLEVFGGDAIVSPGGRIFLIDLNSWPSFARVRAEAAVQISRLALARLRAKKTDEELGGCDGRDERAG
ncbi:MAG: hypothetical protein KGL04_04990 [Elusimicrobia bacterium]|nr:hypothetical protein [Elusimicrobiota bacterium]